IIQTRPIGTFGNRGFMGSVHLVKSDLPWNMMSWLFTSGQVTHSIYARERQSLVSLFCDPTHCLEPGKRARTLARSAEYRLTRKSNPHIKASSRVLAEHGPGGCRMS